MSRVADEMKVLQPLKNVSLEVSLKPFVDLRESAVRDVCRRIFQQWAALTVRAEVISVLIWAADGSEILEYDGNPETPVEWARYIGHANPREAVPNDPEGVALHARNYLYHENPPSHTYATIAMIVRTLKEVGSAMTGKRIRVGATFDPGGEFAKSAFKYERHNEICMGETMGAKSFVCCYATLDADDRRYAGFPNGIPQGTSVGTFLGRQAKHYLRDLDFDYLWLSNGFGFGMETWKGVGPLFDGKVFDATQAPAIREKILNFWRDFRTELPLDVRVELRGTNLGTGSDLATDAVPLREINHGRNNIAMSPNSPWAAINGDFGIELVGYMSRISDLPAGEGFPYRFYLHDPWWLNSPWFDRYGREPHDIYLPLAVSRLDEKGVVQTPEQVQFLTIDDSYGRMPEQGPNEVIPHILRCIDEKPDAPGLLTWIYPFDEFHDFAANAPQRLPLAYYNDWLLRSAINNGLPLNTTVSSKNFVRSLRHNLAAYAHTVLVSLVPDAGTELESMLLQHASIGGKVLLYGPIDRASERMLELLNLRTAEPSEDTLTLTVPRLLDRSSQADWPMTTTHRALFCGGAISHAAVLGSDEVSVFASAPVRGATCPMGVVRRDANRGGGAIAWVRGTNSVSMPKGCWVPTLDDPSTNFSGDLLIRQALSELGISIGFDKRTAGQRSPVLTASRHRGAIVFAGFTPDTTVAMRLGLPGGAPLLVGWDCELTPDGSARYHMPTAWRRECRVLVEQNGGAARCVEHITQMIILKRRLRVDGLRNATVRFLPEPGTESRVFFQPNATWPFTAGPRAEFEREELLSGVCLTVRNVTGSLLISW